MTSGDPGLVDRRRIADDLRSLTLPPNASFLIHSSLRQVGRLSNGPETLIDGLRDACGYCSTIAVPTFTAGNSTTTRTYRLRTAHMSPQQLLVEEAKIAGFDRLSSPSQNVGMVSEYLRKAPGSVRSNHPQTSFCAIGPRAGELVATHELACHLGEESPLGWLYQNDAVVMLIGVGFDVCTCFHLAEYRFAGPATERQYRTFIVNDGRRELVEFHALNTEDRDFAAIGADMSKEPFVRVGQVGHARVHWFPVREAVDFAADWMKRFRYK
jgi:aminoglycoside 3-N-acetyltransferase